MVAFSSTLPIFALAVAIQLPPEVSDRTAARVIENCQAALGPGQCSLERDGLDAEWHATVRWNGMQLLVALEHDSARGTEVARRRVVFSPDDSDEQRWVAAGLIVAALTAAQSKSEEAQEENVLLAEPSVRRRPATAVPKPASADLLHRIIDVGGIVGRGMRSTEPKLGGGVRGWLMLNPARVGATASLSLASSFSNPGVLWYGGGAGVGARVTRWSSSFGLEVRGEFVLEQARVQAARRGVVQAVSSSWRAGGQFGVVASYHLARWAVPWLAIDVSALRPELELRVADERIGAEGDLRWTFSFGGRFHWPGGHD
jgi:hypothetical protein